MAWSDKTLNFQPRKNEVPLSLPPEPKQVFTFTHSDKSDQRSIGQWIKRSGIRKTPRHLTWATQCLLCSGTDALLCWGGPCFGRRFYWSPDNRQCPAGKTKGREKEIPFSLAFLAECHIKSSRFLVTPWTLALVVWFKSPMAQITTGSPLKVPGSSHLDVLN